MPSIAEDSLSAIATKVNSAVEALGGKVFDGEAPLKIDLAYTMTKTVGASRYVVSDAYITWTKFELEPGNALDLDRRAPIVGCS